MKRLAGEQSDFVRWSRLPLPQGAAEGQAGEHLHGLGVVSLPLRSGPARPGPAQNDLARSNTQLILPFTVMSDIGTLSLCRPQSSQQGQLASGAQL